MPNASDTQTADTLFVPDPDAEVAALSQILSVLPTHHSPEQTARALISEFLTAEAVMHASFPELCTVTSKSTAMFLCTQLDLYRLYRISAADCIGAALTRQTAAAYITALFENTDTETVYLICLDRKNRILSRTLLNHGRLSQSNAHIGEIAKLAVASGAAKVVLAHNHPSGICLASAADVICTNTLCAMLEKIGVELLDHLIVSGSVYCGILGKLSPPPDE